jgi:hypothetical protein
MLSRSGFAAFFRACHTTGSIGASPREWMDHCAGMMIPVITKGIESVASDGTRFSWTRVFMPPLPYGEESSSDFGCWLCGSIRLCRYLESISPGWNWRFNF